MSEGFTTENLRIILDCSEGPDKFFVRNVTVSEGISRLYRIELDLLSTDGDINLDGMLYDSVTLQTMTSGGEERCFFNGIVSRIRHAGSSANLTNYVAEVVPSLWRLSLNRDSRIFQAMTVPDIIHKVLDDSGADIDVDDRLEATYAEREYCVQYQESDFAFISRLMEQEGIYYYFIHEDGGHKLVLGDKYDHHEACPVEAEFELKPADAARSERDQVTDFQVERSIQPGVFSTTDYNFKTPGTDLMSKKEGADLEEVYEYPGEFYDTGTGGALAQVHLEELEWQRHIAEGVGECRTFRSGHKFELTSQAGTHDDEYLLIQVTHQASQAGEMGSETAGGVDFNYQVDFLVIPGGVPFRPPRSTPKPGIFGTQTAVVTGKAGEEIWTDSYGRVKVQFHWDREGKNDENSSCWIRCAYGVAGKTWGQIFIPRIGQEVLITFIEGDPDRPVVIAGVYNDEQMPPYPLPDNQTRSTVKSRSSKGGEPANFNEIRFEDKAGSEEIYIHAEKDHNQVTENDRTEDVGHDRTLHVVNNLTENIDVNMKSEIGANKETKVLGDRKMHVQGAEQYKVVGNQTLNVIGTQDNTINGTQDTTVNSPRTMTVFGSNTRTINGSETVHVTGSRSLTVDSPEILKRKVDAFQFTYGLKQDHFAGLKAETMVGAHTSANLSAKMEMVGGVQGIVNKAKVYQHAVTKETKVAGQFKVTVGGLTIKSTGYINIESDAGIVVAAPSIDLAADGGGKVTLKGPNVTIKGMIKED